MKTIETERLSRLFMDNELHDHDARVRVDARVLTPTLELHPRLCEVGCHIGAQVAVVAAVGVEE